MLIYNIHNLIYNILYELQIYAFPGTEYIISLHTYVYHYFYIIYIDTYICTCVYMVVEFTILGIIVMNILVIIHTIFMAHTIRFSHCFYIHHCTVRTDHQIPRNALVVCNIQPCEKLLSVYQCLK